MPEGRALAYARMGGLQAIVAAVAVAGSVSWLVDKGALWVIVAEVASETSGSWALYGSPQTQVPVVSEAFYRGLCKLLTLIVIRMNTKG